MYDTQSLNKYVTDHILNILNRVITDLISLTKKYLGLINDIKFYVHHSPRLNERFTVYKSMYDDVTTFSQDQIITFNTLKYSTFPLSTAIGACISSCSFA